MFALGVTVGGGLEKLSQGRNFFFLIPAPTQLSAYANHEFKIISTPAQLSAYANHELKKQQERSIEAVHMHSLSETSRKQIMHISRIDFAARRAKILLHMLSICTKHVNHELNL